MRQSAMPVERPGVVLVFAILNIVLGTLGAVIQYCGGALLERYSGFLTSSEWVLPSGSTMPIPPFPSDALAVSIAELVTRFALFIALIFAGLGLLGMNAWARKLSIALSILGILWALVMPALTSLYLKPKIEKWEKDLLQAVRNQLKDQNLQPPNPRFKSPAMSAIGSLLMPSLVATYSIVMLGFMLRPQVAMAFTGQGSRQGTDWQGESLPLGGEEKAADPKSGN
jgi:hypothetical protein